MSVLTIILLGEYLRLFYFCGGPFRDERESANRIMTATAAAPIAMYAVVFDPCTTEVIIDVNTGVDVVVTVAI